MDKKLYAPFIWLVVFVLAVGLACSVQLTDEKPTETAVKEKPTKRPTATQVAATEAPTEPPAPTEAPPTRTTAPEPSDVAAPTDAQPSVEGNPNASQSGDVYFQTEFNDVEGWGLLSVPDVDENRYRVFEDNGQLYMEIHPEGVTLYAFYKLILNNSDVQVDTVAQKVAGPNTNNLSVICRASDEGWYEFSMTSGGYWYIWLYYNGKYKQLAKGASMAINMKNQANQLTATCVGSDLTFYVNGSKLGTVKDRTLMGGGQVGVSIYSEYPDLGVVFEWFSALVP